MAIIQNTMENIKWYIGNNKQTDGKGKENALRALLLFECPQFIQNSAMQAVVGFSEDNAPIFWDMTTSNLLATCTTGVGMNYMGSTTALVSLVLRFTPKELQYYLLVDEYAPEYLRRDEHCAGTASAMFEGRDNYINCLEGLYKQLKYRSTISGNELSKLPFLLVVFGNDGKSFGGENVERFSELFSLLLRDGKKLRTACMITTTRFEEEFIYHRNKDAFSGFVVGRTNPEIAEELLENDIPDWIINGHVSDKFIFKREKMRVQIRSYHSALGIGLR